MKNNFVAKHGLRINRCKVEVNRKNAQKRGYTKHKKDYANV